MSEDAKELLEEKKYFYGIWEGLTKEEQIKVIEAQVKSFRTLANMMMSIVRRLKQNEKPHREI